MTKLIRVMRLWESPDLLATAVWTGYSLRGALRYVRDNVYDPRRCWIDYADAPSYKGYEYV